MNALLSKGELTAEEAELASSTLDNIITYTRETDCEASSEETETLKSTTEENLDVMVDGLIEGLIPGSDPIEIVNNNYNIFV